MKIIVDAKDYNLQEDKRLLIPYMEEKSRYGIDLGCDRGVPCHNASLPYQFLIKDYSFYI